MDSSTIVKEPQLPKPAELAEESAGPAVEPARFAAWLTVEVGLYLALALVALGLRLWRLGVYPLSNGEAGQALVALDFARGAAPSGGGYSPLLMTLQGLSFFLFGASEVTARLGPALLGAALVLLPAGLRPYLGRIGALAAAALLALSPSTLYLSRTVNGEIGVAAGVLAVVVALFAWFQGAGGWQTAGPAGEVPPLILRPAAPWLLGAGLALLLTAGLLAYSAILALLLAVGAVLALGRIGPGPGPAVPRPTSAELRRAGAWAAALFVGLSTTALFNLDGIAGATDLFTAWLNAFRPGTGAAGGPPGLGLLVFYEPAIFWPGLAGLALALWRRNRFSLFLAVWFLAGLLLDALMPGRPAGALILLVLPLALLAGSSLAALGQGLHRQGRREREGLILLLGLVLEVFSYVQLTLWTRCQTGLPNCDSAWLIPAVVQLALLVLVAMFVMGYGLGVALRGLALTLAVLAVIGSVGAAWRLNYGPLRWLPYEPLAGEAPATEVLTLQRDLARLSAEQVGDPHLLEMRLVGLDSPLLRWQLRDFSRLNPPSTVEAPAVLAPATLSAEQLNLNGPYAGQAYKLTATWGPAGLDRKAQVRWFLYREAPTMPVGESVVLWVRQQG